MDLNRLIDRLVDRPWIDSLSKNVQKSVKKVYGATGPVGQQVQNFLHGTWLGHPLHPVLTDIPIGAYTVSFVLDLLESTSGRRELGPGADTALAVGLAGGLAAATTGMTDWYHLGRDARRVGMVHALFNTTATVLYIGSLALRRRGARGAGRALAYAGYALIGAGGYLGGHLVFSQQIGVDHVEDEPEPDEFATVMTMDEIGQDRLHHVRAGETDVLLVRHEGQIYALADTCSHLGCSLAEGELVDGSVRCRCHGSRFALADGKVLDGPSTYWQPVYRVRIRNGHIEVGKRELQI